MFQTFSEAGLPQPLFHRLEQMGFINPTPIQAEAIPHALNGLDILGSAQTGTGKTGAYGIPLVVKLLTENEGNALVLLPTRELALQVMQTLQKFIGNSNIKTALLIGGEEKRKQFRQLNSNPRLIVGTPGRINDHLIAGALKLDRVNFLVLDEVDRMLDMGFGIQLDAIARYLSANKRQTLMFSATLPSNIQKLSGKYLTDPIRISVGETHAPAANVKQENITLTENEKYQRLLKELNEREGSILVFVKTKSSADDMAFKLRKADLESQALHGDLRQHKRNKVILDFRKQKYRILVATDVAARGLDISHIEHVINYDLPQCPEDYIHRIGRTARAGAEGVAVNFISPADKMKWRAITRLLNPQDSNDNSNFAEEGNYSKPKRSRSRDRFGGGFKDRRGDFNKRPRREREEFGDKGGEFNRRPRKERDEFGGRDGNFNKRSRKERESFGDSANERPLNIFGDDFKKSSKKAFFKKESRFGSEDRFDSNDAFKKKRSFKKSFSKSEGNSEFDSPFKKRRDSKKSFGKKSFGGNGFNKKGNSKSRFPK
jgi:ATP-dependent RNA helicase DeaD